MTTLYTHPVALAAADIDAFGHVNNVTYVRWMQDAAVAHSSALGWSTAAYRALGQGWVVRRHQVEYLRPAFLGEAIVVRTWVATLGKVTSRRQYEIVRLPGEELLVRAETEWAFVDWKTGQPTRIAPTVLESFRPVLASLPEKARSAS